VLPGRKIIERHQVLAVAADIRRVMVNRVFLSGDFPAQRISGNRCRHAHAVVNSRFNLRAFFIIVPCHQLQEIELGRGVVEAVGLRESLQPGLSTLLTHHALRSPRCQSVIEAFVGGANRFLLRKLQTSLVEISQVAHSEIGRGWHYPRIAAIREDVIEAGAILKNE